MREPPDRPLDQEESERLERAEQEALRMLNRAMTEGRWYPRRQMRFAMVVFALFLGVLIVTLLMSRAACGL